MLRSILIAVLCVSGLIACTTALRSPSPYQQYIPTDAVTIAVVGDQQRTSIFEVWRERNTMHGKLVRQVVRSKPSALVLLGDQVFKGDSQDDWLFFDRIMRPVRRANIPVFPLLGNHEYFGMDRVMLENMSTRFPSMQHRYYVVVIDSIAFVMLDTNFDEYHRDSTASMRRWYTLRIEELTADPSVRCIVTCGHHPPYTNSSIVMPDRIQQEYFVPIFLRSPKARLWLSGHVHAYEHFRHGNVHFVVSGGGGGPRQFLRLDSLTHSDHDIYRGGPIRPFHYLSLSRSEHSLCVSMIPLEGYNAHGESFVIDSIGPSVAQK